MLLTNNEHEGGDGTTHGKKCLWADDMIAPPAPGKYYRKHIHKCP